MKDLPLLIEKLSPMSARWNLLGIQLGIDLNLLNGFAQENNDVKLYFAETLSFWSKQRKPPSALMKALRSSTFRYIYLAENLKDKYGSKMGGSDVSNLCNIIHTTLMAYLTLFDSQLGRKKMRRRWTTTKWRETAFLATLYINMNFIFNASMALPGDKIPRYLMRGVFSSVRRYVQR